jgi:ubiquinone/menaquinone biosynthesis C-methylase UbiE
VVILSKCHRIPQEFDRLADSYARLNRRRPGREATRVIDWMRLPPHALVLDAACGPALWARTLAESGARSIALDISPRMLELARCNDSHRAVPLTLGEVEALPYGAGTFDLVACSYAFANFPRPLAVLGEFARVIRPEGRIAIIDVVAPENRRWRSRLNQVEACRSRLYTRILSRTQFLKLFEAAGLVVLRSAAHSSVQNTREWLELSPALRRHSAARIRGLLQSIRRTASSSERPGPEHSVRYTSGWFLLARTGTTQAP